MQVRPINPINVVSFCNLSSQVENTNSQLSHLEMNTLAFVNCESSVTFGEP